MAKLYGKGTITEIVKGKKYRIELSAGKDPLTGRIYDTTSNVPDNACAIDANGLFICPKLVYCKATDEEKNLYRRWRTPVKYRKLRETFLGTKRQAELRLEEMRREAETGARPDSDKLSYAELSNEFISREERHGVNSRTQKPLRTATKDDLRTTERAVLRSPWFACMHIVDITAGDLLHLYDEMRENGTGATTISKAHRQIDRVMKYAIKNRIITFNPCDDLERREIPTKPRPSRKSLSEAQVIQILTKLLNSEPTSRNAAVAITLCTGMRRGEVLGLQWRHVDFENGRIVICQQFTKEGELHGTKADEIHIVPLEDALSDYLVQWRQIQARYIDSLNAGGKDGDGYPGRMRQTPDTPVITDSMGSWYSPKNFSKWYREWCVDNGLGHWEDDDGRKIVELTLGESAKAYEGCRICWRDKEGWPCDDQGRRYSRTNRQPKISKHYVGLTFHELRHTFFTLFSVRPQWI